MIQIYKTFFWYNINISNPRQNEIQNERKNEIERIKEEINLLQDNLEKNEKRQNQFQNGLKRVKKVRIKKDKVN